MPLINPPRAWPGIFKAKRRCCGVLIFVIGVREYDMAPTQNDDVCRGVHSGDERDLL